MYVCTCLDVTLVFLESDLIVELVKMGAKFVITI